MKSLPGGIRLRPPLVQYNTIQYNTIPASQRLEMALSDIIDMDDDSEGMMTTLEKKPLEGQRPVLQERGIAVHREHLVVNLGG